jgi:5-methylthioadenosine/S-adenosylhomocysteine deaminase
MISLENYRKKREDKRLDADIVIKNATILTMNADSQIHLKGYLLIKGQKIISVGDMVDFPKGDHKEVIDAKGKIILPGFVNTHTHLSMVLFRGLSEDTKLQDWLSHIWKYEGYLSKTDCYEGAYIACMESIRSGVTCIHDMYFYEDEIAKACQEAGIRAVLSYGIIDKFAEDVETRREEELKKTEDFIQKWHKKNDLISVSVAPHAPNTCTPKTLLKSRELAKKYDCPIHIHIAETKEEKKEIEKEHHKGVVKYLEDLGFLDDSHTIGAHCVWLDDEEIKIFKEKNIKVAHNPSSNMKLASGLARIPEMLEKDIIVGLGTDGAGSNNNLSILMEMRLAGLIQKGFHRNAELLPALKIVQMATIDGAKVLGLEEDIGSLEVGKSADICIFDLMDINVHPYTNIYSTVVYSLKEYNLEHVLINGKFVYKNKDFIDKQLIRNHMNRFKHSFKALQNRVEQKK